MPRSALSKPVVRYADVCAAAPRRGAQQDRGQIAGACKTHPFVFLYVDTEGTMANAQRMLAKALFNVAGLSAVITGGATGIGYAYAEAMVANGASVTLVDIDRDAVDAAVAGLGKWGAPVSGSIADVTDSTALHNAIAAVAARTGRLDVVFANAGITAGPGFLTTDGASRDAGGAIETIAPSLWDKVLATNLRSVFTTIRSCVGPMKAQGGGSIVATTSIAGLRPSAVVGTPYMVAKAGAAHLVRQAALELAAYGIRVNAIAPGPFATRITSPGLHATWSRALPVGRVASADEIKGLALFLASPASAYVTGAQFVIDGGSLLGWAGQAD
jgi:NAD(P)-dependent dehydrogenase (short-subunit alcohol dehydrogenase family)